MKELPKSRLNDISIGDYLYSTCGADIAGTIVNINDVDFTIDMIMYDGSNCFIDNDNDTEISELGKRFVNVPLYADNIPVDHLWEIEFNYNNSFKLGIQLKPNWRGCNRCTASFWVMKKEVEEEYYKDMIEYNFWKPGQPLPQDYTKYLILK
jgi:hypothetical protein